ncbi:MAG: hypothetical protein FWH25_03325 [Syntrophorhabdaceae bacterium]|nr:hypothetical protein [Syntrophorhabdaceae bacterium]
MTKKMKISELPEFDAAELLKDNEDMAAYLSVVIEENDPALLVAALGDIARAGNDRDRKSIRHHTRGSL